MNQMIIKMIQLMILLAIGRTLSQKAFLSEEAVAGIPFFLAVYGLEELGQYTVLGVGHEIYAWMLLIPGLHLAMKHEKISLKMSLKTLTSPVIISMAVVILRLQF